MTTAGLNVPKSWVGRGCAAEGYGKYERQTPPHDWDSMPRVLWRVLVMHRSPVVTVPVLESGMLTLSGILDRHASLGV